MKTVKKNQTNQKTQNKTPNHHHHNKKQQTKTQNKTKPQNNNQKTSKITQQHKITRSTFIQHYIKFLFQSWCIFQQHPFVSHMTFDVSFALLLCSDWSLT